MLSILHLLLWIHSPPCSTLHCAPGRLIYMDCVHQLPGLCFLLCWPVGGAGRRWEGSRRERFGYSVRQFPPGWIAGCFSPERVSVGWPSFTAGVLATTPFSCPFRFPLWLALGSYPTFLASFTPLHTLKIASFRLSSIIPLARSISSLPGSWIIPPSPLWHMRGSYFLILLTKVLEYCMVTNII